jgi:hypothetical protein
MTKADLHQIVDHLPEQAVDGAAILLGEISNGRIDPEQAWFWTREWQQREREADEDLSAGRVTRYESDEQFLVALGRRIKRRGDLPGEMAGRRRCSGGPAV